MKFTSVVLAMVFACGTALATDNVNNKQSNVAPSDEKELLLPMNYRSWVALAPTTPGMPTHHHQHLVSKVYVEPSAYDGFLKTHAWPNHTVIVLELRDKATPPKTVCDGMIGLEVASKDEAHRPDPWSYYGIIYDREKAHKTEARSVCADCANEPIDMRLAMYFPALKAVIHGQPDAMQPSAF